MDYDFDKMYTELMSSLSSIEGIEPSLVPDLELYMDQVLSFMNKNLAKTLRDKDDKTLTKTMINNYAKNKIFPSPVKKRYTKDHMLTLMLIYYFKNILSINDIGKLLTPITETYFTPEAGIDMEAIYREVYQLETTHLPEVLKQIEDAHILAKSAFTDTYMDKDEREYLEIFTFISTLCFDIYTKKLLVEKMIDRLENVDPKKKR